MLLVPLSWNSNAFSPNYSAGLPLTGPLVPPADPVYIERAGNWPAFGTKRYGGHTIALQLFFQGALSDQHTREAEIKRWFDPLDEEPRKLLAQDTADSNRQWYVMGTTVSVTLDKNSAIIVLAVTEPYWTVETKQTATWNISASPATKAVAVIGAFARPKFTFTPTLAKGVGYLYYRFVDIQPISTAANAYLSNYAMDIGNGINTAALVSGGKCQADGDDFRVIVDGGEVPRWFGNFNTSSTKIWINLTFYQKTVMDLGENIAASHPSLTTIQIIGNPNSREAMTRMPSSGILKIDSEYFTYSGKDMAAMKFTGVVPAAKLSSMGAHSIGTGNVVWIQHDIWIMYGNPTTTAPIQDESKKPMFDLASSTNASWVYTEFYKEGESRAGAWIPAVYQTDLGSSAPYTGNRGATADPATEAGLRMASAQDAGIWRGETADIFWTVFCPVGITHITLTGEKYRYSTGWPTVSLLRTLNGRNFIPFYSVATPGSAATWTAWSLTSQALGTTSKFVRLEMAGSLAGSASNEADVEIESCTLTLDTSMTPTVSVASEQQTYYLEATLTNTQTGHAITLTWPMKLNNSLVVDCDARTVTYSDGTPALSAMTMNTNRSNWLDLLYGSNTLQFVDTGTNGLTLAIEWADKVYV